MAKHNSHHVLKSTDDGWDVKKGGSMKASKHFDTKEEAIAWGRSVSKNQKSELYIHGKDGKIQSKNSYRSDQKSSRKVK